MNFVNGFRLLSIWMSGGLEIQHVLSLICLFYYKAYNSKHSISSMSAVEVHHGENVGNRHIKPNNRKNLTTVS